MNEETIDRMSLGNRMKQYEFVSQSKLLRRTPVIIRVDGKAFHTFVKKLTYENDSSLFYGPFSHKLHNVMVNTAISVASQIQNTVFGYTQSDEISFLLRDWNKLSSEQWFDGKIQKITSIAASLTSVYFNWFLEREFNDTKPSIISDKVFDLSVFDARVFNLPKEEVTNYFIWRQQDATRNSVQMLGRHYFSHRDLFEKNRNQIQDMLMSLIPAVNWNNLSTWKKRGAGFTKNPDQHSSTPFVINDETPIFTQDRHYIEQHLEVEEHE